MLEFIQTGSFRRILVLAMTSTAAFLHRKLGIELDVMDLIAMVTPAIVYIAGGNIKEAAIAKAEIAVAKPSTTEEDAALLGGKVEERK